MKIPNDARAVIIGGGVSGCSIAYHLTKLGWKDVVLVERKKLTSGTTWHAAGLIGQLRGNLNMTRLAKYSVNLYSQLEEETGIATGIKQNGSLTVALTLDRQEEIFRQASLARAFDVEAYEISPSDIKKKYPHLNTDGVLAGVFLPKDGQADPSNIALALAKGARQMGAQIFEGTKVMKVLTKDSKVAGVSYVLENGEQGVINSDVIINCAGMWSRQLAAENGVNIPLHACEHFYIVTEPVDGLGQLPVLRVPDECAYYKEDAGKMLLGAFEPRAKPWGMNGIPEDFCFDQIPEDIDHFEPILEMGVNRLPMLGKVGIHTFFNGPESFTPDDRYYLGEAPNLTGYWVAAGYNSIGIVSSGGAGMALAQWINDDSPPFDLWDVDIRRAQPFQKNRKYLKERVSESLGLLYADHYPYRQMVTSRGVRRSILHDSLKSKGAVFGEIAGYERVNWFALDGQNPEYHYDWGRQNWFENHQSEHLAIRENVGLFDMSSFGKIRVDGLDALILLQNVCAGQIDVDVGRIVYTQMLNSKGGIESDLTVTRLSENSFLLVVPCATVQRDLAWLNKHNSGLSVVILDFSAGEAVLCLMGPNSRKVLSGCSPNNFSNEAHPFGVWRNIEIGMGLARAHRVTYVGELGWEIYVSSDQAQHVFEEIQVAGVEHNLKLCGMHTLDSCRIEKAYRHFGHDITDEDHVLEAGLGFAVKVEKGNFIGRDAVLKKRDEGMNKVLLQFALKDPSPMMFHNEPIVRDDVIVGYISSANYGHYIGSAIGLGYVPCKGEDLQTVLKSQYEIEIAGKRFESRVSAKPMYDPKSLRTKM
jgi:glycine cleavage system aminomethyltransferase T/glycine/D-amino acid oxidase-like deaminating enzyme